MIKQASHWKLHHCPKCFAYPGIPCGRQRRGICSWQRMKPHAARKRKAALINSIIAVCR